MRESKRIADVLESSLKAINAHASTINHLSASLDIGSRRISGVNQDVVALINQVSRLEGVVDRLSRRVDEVVNNHLAEEDSD